jgi:hypothetical protein
MSGPIRWFIGTSANGEDLEAEMVLVYSAHKHCSLPLEITFMRQAAKGPYAGWRSSRRGRTPFTSFRWSPPAMCGYEGRAIYTDVDYLVMADLAELWTQDMHGAAILLNRTTGKLQTSTMLFDCAACKGLVPGLETLKQKHDANDEIVVWFRNHRQYLGAFEGDWNCVDGAGYRDVRDPRIKAHHFSRIESQLHLKYAVSRLATEGKTHWYTGERREHPRADLVALFDALYAEAQASGYSIDQFRVDGFTGATRRNFTYSHHVGAAIA